MEKIQIPAGDPTPQHLVELEVRCKAVLEPIRSEDSEVKLPVIVEFSGSPKSGKSSIIGIVVHFFKRMGADVLSPPEGASARTPPGLRDDWLAFNAWSGCYALQHVLIDCSVDPPQTMVILDRGLFDVAGWMEFLCNSLHRITEADRKAICDFFGLDIWLKRENAVFLFTADHSTSIRRENHSKLTKASGSVMNEATLADLQKAYAATAESFGKNHVQVFHVDTSEQPGVTISFQQVARVVAERIIMILEDMSAQKLLVTAPAAFSGFCRDGLLIQETISQILANGNPRFLDRHAAETTTAVQQIVPYAILENADGRYFQAKRRSDARRQELRSRFTLLVGGHAEERDFDPRNPAAVFEHCLRRELDEELIGLKINEIEPLGFINDTRNQMGSHHLAFVHRVRIGGRTSIRRQAIDKEFGRESVLWQSAEEIARNIGDFDPWSQLVASALFNIAIPAEQQQLFTQKG